MLSDELRRLRAQADAQTERNGPIWAVDLDAPCERVFCATGGQDVDLVRVLLGDRLPFRKVATDRDGIVCVACDPPLIHLAACEVFMPGLMAVLRANALHGTYREAGTTKRYRF